MEPQAPQAKTHRDYQQLIGGTAATASGLFERRWNRYYHRAYTATVAAMLRGEPTAGAAVLDVGTSHGNWFGFLAARGFGRILGVELDPGRAELALRRGYHEVFNCDAADLPLPDRSLDFAVSNDVFVHILRLEDKAAVLREVERVLRPGGVFILNHALSGAFGHRGYTVERHCSYLEPDDCLRLVLEHTGFVVEDLKPTHYTFAGRRPSLAAKLARLALLMLPGGIALRRLRDCLLTRRLPLGQADTLYLKLRKPLPDGDHTHSRGR